MKVALPKRRSFICDYQRLTYPLLTFNTHKRYAGTPLFVSNSCTVICFVRCNTRNPRLSASGQTQSNTRTTDFFCLTFSNQSLMWTFRFQLETANMGCIFHRGRKDRSHVDDKPWHYITNRWVSVKCVQTYLSSSLIVMTIILLWLFKDYHDFMTVTWNKTG